MSAPSVRRTSPCARAGCDRPRTARPIGGQSRAVVYAFSIRRAGTSDTPHNWLGGKIGRQCAEEAPPRVCGGRPPGKAGRSGADGCAGGGRLCGLTAVNFLKALYLQHERPGVLLHRHPDFQKLDTCQPAQPRIPRTAAPRTRAAPPSHARSAQPRAPRAKRARRPHHGRRRALNLLSRKSRRPRRADYFAASSRPTRYGKVVQQAPRFWPWNAKL